MPNLTITLSRALSLFVCGGLSAIFYLPLLYNMASGVNQVIFCHYFINTFLINTSVTIKCPDAMYLLILSVFLSRI